MTRILVTGANGFVGSALCSDLLQHGIDVVPAVRFSRGGADRAVGDLSATTDWSGALGGCHVVVHLAARVHMMRDEAVDPLAEFRQVNVVATMNLARQAAASGVKRFVFMSSIGVNGSNSDEGVFTENSAVRPHSPYAVSKAEAERELIKFCEAAGMEWVVIRPPLVYDYRAPGNFESLLKIVEKGAPLPFSAVRNRRSLVCLENLVDFVRICTLSERAADQLFLVADRESVSTPELLGLLSEGMGNKPRSFPFPVSLMKLGAIALGKKNLFQQLCGSLEVDAAKARQILAWVPPVSVHAGLRNAARKYYNEKTI